MLEKKAHNTISYNSLLSPGEFVLVAVSGGPDSVALLHYLLNTGSYKITVFHLNHMLRDSAYSESEFVKSLCREFGLSLINLEFDVKSYAKDNKLTIQDAARQVRYKLLRSEARKIGATKIAIGHNADDQVETFFMRLIRGASLKGLTSIPVKRGIIIRPLLNVTRKEIIKYLKKNKTGFVTDPTNLKPVYLRNKFRLEILPLFEKLNPNFYQVILKNIELITDDENLLTDISKQSYGVIASEKGTKTELDYQSLETLPLSLRRRVCLTAIEKLKGNVKSIESSHIEDILAKYSRKTFSMDLPGKLKVYREYQYLVFELDKKIDTRIIEPVELNVPGSTNIASLELTIKSDLIENGTCLFGEYDACLDADKVVLPLKARTRKNGDRFTPLGMKNAKKLQDFFVDRKIPVRKRDTIAVIEDEKGIVWVAGYEIDERVKITAESKNIIHLSLNLH